MLESINCTDGDFVVREKRDQWKEFVLTVRVKCEYKHHEIHCVEEGKSLNKKFYIEENRGFNTLEELIKYYQEGKVSNFEVFSILEIVILCLQL